MWHVGSWPSSWFPSIWLLPATSSAIVGRSPRDHGIRFSGLTISISTLLKFSNLMSTPKFQRSVLYLERKNVTNKHLYIRINKDRWIPFKPPVYLCTQWMISKKKVFLRLAVDISHPARCPNCPQTRSGSCRPTTGSATFTYYTWCTAAPYFCSRPSDCWRCYIELVGHCTSAAWDGSTSIPVYLRLVAISSSDAALLSVPASNRGGQRGVNHPSRRQHPTLFRASAGAGAACLLPAPKLPYLE